MKKKELSIDDQERIKSIQKELGEELKKQRGKKKESNNYKLNWKSFYFDEKSDDPYKNGGAKIQYSYLCAEAHNQMSLIHNYSKAEKFNIRKFRVNDKIGIFLPSQGERGQRPREGVILIMNYLVS